MNIDIETLLFSAADREYAAFSAKLIPNIRRDVFIGVRSPVLRRLARERNSERGRAFFPCCLTAGMRKICSMLILSTCAGITDIPFLW